MNLRGAVLFSQPLFFLGILEKHDKKRKKEELVRCCESCDLLYERRYRHDVSGFYGSYTSLAVRSAEPAGLHSKHVDQRWITSLCSLKTRTKKKMHFANDAPFESSLSHRAAGLPGSLQSHLTQLTPLMTRGQMTQSYALALRPTKPYDYGPTG